jgi:putative FmdB family regulatory protein
VRRSIVYPRPVPTYEYRCPNGHLFEVFKSITAPAPEVCPTCGEGPVEVVLHPVAVHFKGSGFYSTDYGRGNRRKGEGSKDGDGGSSSGGSSSGDASDKKESSSEKKAAEA